MTTTTCNMCGEPCELRGYKNFKIDKDTNEILSEFDGEFCETSGLIDCKVPGGYNSTAGNGYGALDDCTSYRFSMCEWCLDWLFSQFKISPNISDYMAGGTPDEESFKPAAERVKEDEWRRMKVGFFKEYNRRAELRKK